MNKISVNFENCYGIRKLKYTFDFSQKRTFAIYSPNGVMKTSFAKTFKDICNGNDTHDLIFPERKSKRIVKDESNNDLKDKNVFVIEPYNETYKSGKVSTLLVNAKLKNQYEKIHIEIDNKKEALLKELKPLSGIKANIEEVISEVFTRIPSGFFTAITRIESEVFDDSPPAFEGIVYKRIFTDKVEKFLSSKDIRLKLQEYMNKYDNIIDSSTYFKKGIFNHNNASVIAKNLKENGFFKAKHSISLNDKSKKFEITTEKELEEVIEKEKQSILNNPELLNTFNEIDKKLNANKELRDFREYLIQNMVILPELLNLEAFKEKLWINYLKIKSDFYKNLLDEYKSGKKEIEDIIQQAKKEITAWSNVIEIFNERFSVPFKLSIGNQDQVILNDKAPIVKFQFFDNDDSRAVEENELLAVLSSGEKRALYLLNIVFEVQARKNESIETLFIIDDIADSFDYKNKYAIIEYLEEISEFDTFYQIILSHNYDFFRTISSRLDMGRKNKLNTERSDKEVKLIEEKYQNNPFTTWKDHLDTKMPMLIASIPFVRNLAEYSGEDTSFQKLTSLLHYKENSSGIKMTDLQSLLKRILKDKPSLSLPNPSKRVLDVIFETAEEILNDSSEVIDLENKIVLAISIRLKTEMFIVKKISDDSYWKSITKNQSFVLYEKFKEKFPSEESEIKILEQVNLMTPENIHVNSFMYEPILDMANVHLKTLYEKINNLYSKE